MTYHIVASKPLRMLLTNVTKTNPQGLKKKNSVLGSVSKQETDNHIFRTLGVKAL